jgi:hypothetical protein
MAKLNHRNRTGQPSPVLKVKALLRMKRAQEKQQARIPFAGFLADKKGLKNLAYLASLNPAPATEGVAA